MKAVLLGGAVLAFTLAAGEAPRGLERCNVVWTAPSRDASGAMPLGNGEVGISLWVEGNGDLVFYVARTDAWSEASRLLKLGRVRVKLEPNPFAGGSPFRQELRLRDGCAVIRAGAPGVETVLKVFVDPRDPVVHVLGSGAVPLKVTASVDTWRTERRRLEGGDLDSSWTMKDAPPDVPVWESADVAVDRDPGAAVIYHRNEGTVVPFTLAHQGLAQAADQVRDPLVNRTFGLWMTAPGFKKAGTGVLRSDGPCRSFAVAVAAPSAQTPTAEAWLDLARRSAANAAGPAKSAHATRAWWHQFWDRSWIFVQSGPKGPAITQAYQLQRWMTACQGRGAYPIKFNGGLFTTEPGFLGGKAFNPDFRRWGDCYWYQNTRHMYAPMLPAGDRDCMDAFFGLYERAVPLAEARSKVYYGAQGAYFPETMTAFGTYGNCDYGWDRAGHTPGEILCPWWALAWNQGLELVQTMLDTYAWTGDEAFARIHLLPMAESVLRYFDTRFKKTPAGRIVLSPTQAVETYWKDVLDDAPTVAGLRAVTAGLTALPRRLGSPAQRAFFQRMREACPPIPFETRTVAGRAQRSLAPAAAYDPERSNIESPELYPVWPFRLYGVGRPDLEAARTAYWTRQDHTENGWGYDGIVAANLGLPDEAARILLGKCANANPRYRFPAMWGPNFDWLPDQNHGGTLMSIAQNMLLQPVGAKLYLLPAWPKDWDVHFRLHAPGKTVVECEYRGGRIRKLTVVPKSRAGDLVMPGQ